MKCYAIGVTRQVTILTRLITRWSSLGQIRVYREKFIAKEIGVLRSVFPRSRETKLSLGDIVHTEVSYTRCADYFRARRCGPVDDDSFLDSCYLINQSHGDTKRPIGIEARYKSPIAAGATTISRCADVN